jgi:hypothetical protein
VKPLKHFDILSRAIDYLTQESLATLEADYLRMRTAEYRHYTDEDRADMRDKIADVRLAVKHITEGFAFLEQIARMKTEEEYGDDAPPAEDWTGTLSDLITTARTLTRAEKKGPL